MGPGVFVSVYPSQHSCIWTGTHGAGSGEVCIGDLGVTWPERSARMKELHGRMATSLDRSSIEHLLSASGANSDRGDGGTLLYLFELPQGSLLFQDTAGHWRSILGGLRPDVAILAAAGRANIDGDPVQGSWLISSLRKRGPSPLAESYWHTTTTGCPVLPRLPTGAHSSGL